MSPATKRILLERWENGQSSRAPDDVLIEEPLRISVDGEELTTTMRTPGEDFELAAGLAVSEGLLRGASVQSISYPRQPAGNEASSSSITTVELRTSRQRQHVRRRLSVTTSACGLCGHEAIDELLEWLTPFTHPSLLGLELVADVVSTAFADQPRFARTGVAHGAAIVDLRSEPQCLVLREDVGRHNAVDKAVGSLVLAGELDTVKHVSRQDLALVVSGRASFEMVQKAWAAGIGALVSVSGPSSLAVETARRAGLTLVGFARPGSANRYSP